MNCACCYDWLMGPLERAYLRTCRARLCSGLSGRIVEIGAGTGVNFEFYPPDCQVLALEPDPAMRARAQKRHRPIEVSPASAEHIPLGSGQADHCVSTLVLCSVADPAAVLREIARVLKPGGCLHLLEHSRGRGAWGVLHDHLTPLWSWLTGGCHLNRRPQQRVLEAGFSWQHSESVFRILGADFLMGSAQNGQPASESAG